jgi:fused signal recognition particle receptor
MIALWIALGVVAFAILVGGSVRYATTSRRRRGPAARPSSATRPAPTRPRGAGPAGAPPGVEAPPGPEPVIGATPSPEGERAVEAHPAHPALRDRLGRSRGVFAGLRSLRGRGVDPATWEELEETLLRADVGVATAGALLGDLRRRVASKEIGDGDQLLEALRADLLDLLDVEHRWDGATAEPEANDVPERVPALDNEETEPVGRALRFDDEPGVVNVWLFVGVNGVGKTTTVGKVARQQASAGRSVLLAAGDTFRAAAGEQLETWAGRAGAEIVRGSEGGDPSAVVFDAVQRASARGNSLVLADTAGRLHTKVNLVEELKKIRRVADRAPGRVTEVLLVLDATTGQNGLVQAREFTEAVAVTGVVLTKLDGTAKGGIVVAIQRDLGLPVKMVGVGEDVDDLVSFEPGEFVAALLS